MYWKTFNTLIAGPLKFCVLKIKFHSEVSVTRSITQQWVYKLDRKDVAWRRKMLRCRAPTNTETNNKWPQWSLLFPTFTLQNCQIDSFVIEECIWEKVVLGGTYECVHMCVWRGDWAWNPEFYVIHECLHMWFGGETGHEIQSFIYTN